jgi:antibiotic biosynthesis monooxygenase (ABM) superfamily enzyme
MICTEAEQMEKKRFFELVGTGPKPGKEAEYNAWYDEHVKLLFEYEGLKKVTRTRIFEPWGANGIYSPQYVTIYEFEKKEDFHDFCYSPTMKIADTHYNTQGRPISEIYWAGGYESLTILEK